MATEAISVFAFNEQPLSVGSMSVLPSDALGTYHIAVVNFERHITGAETQLLLVAAHDNTRVEIRFPPHGLFSSITVPGLTTSFGRNSVHLVSSCIRFCSTFGGSQCGAISSM